MCRIIELNINEHQPIKSWIGLFESLLAVWTERGGELRSVQPDPRCPPKWAAWTAGRQWLAVPNGTPNPYVLPREWFERMELLEVGSPRKIEIIDLNPVQEAMLQRWIRVACFTESFLRMDETVWYVQHPEHGACQMRGLETIYDQLGPTAFYVALLTPEQEEVYFELGYECTEGLFHDPNWLREWLFHTDWDFVQP